MDMITLAMAKAYTDKKAGYVEVSEAVIFENLAVSGGEADTTVTTQMIPGKTYIVTVGGVKYERVCYTEALDGIACVGNARLYDFVNEDNGDDFFVGQARETIVQCYTRNMGDTTITLAEKTETIHPIDPKFIPGAPLFDLTKIGLPAVQLNSSVMVETTDVSEISAAMDAGNIKIKTLVSIDGAEIDVYANLLPAYLPAAQTREAATVLAFGGKVYAIILTVYQIGINLSVVEV